MDNVPASASHDGTHLSRRDDQIIEPGSANGAKTNSQAKLARHPAALPIKTEILAVFWGNSIVGM